MSGPLAEGIAGGTEVILAIIGLENVTSHVISPVILNLVPLLWVAFSNLLSGMATKASILSMVRP
ncbi:MAG TPA: hypothetical protein VLG72_00420 [Nitrospirota bacterium]|nr:hypothetical protein [Nitrospirota bacterium]